MKTWELAFFEVAPPGREPQVRALKNKPGIDNPYAVAWSSYNQADEGGPGSTRWGKKTAAKGKKASKKAKALRHTKKVKQANSAGGLPQTLRGRKTQAGYMCSDRDILQTLLRESTHDHGWRFQESTRFREVITTAPPGIEGAPQGPMAMCVLITEGLGNRADMHYYGPECIEGGAKLFEGKPCFVDHQARSEVNDRPERTVRDKCGYFRNVRAEEVDGRLGLVGELHFDLSETGSQAFAKAATAVHYKAESPDTGEEYVGLSIAADGDLEERTMEIGGESLDVKYVTRFTSVGSIDQVTSPARGGRFIKIL